MMMTSRNKRHKKLRRALWRVVLFLAVIGSAAQYYLSSTPAHISHASSHAAPASSVAADSAVVVTSPDFNITPAFRLTAHTGEIVTEQSFAGKYLMVFFGFTSCPDVCPLEFQTMQKVYGQLSAAQQEKIQPLFITVDPARDTVPQMRQYVTLFPTLPLIGLTGSAEEVRAAADAFKVYSAVDHHAGATEYSMNHSALTYLIDPQHRLQAIFKTPLDEKGVQDYLKGAL